MEACAVDNSGTITISEGKAINMSAGGTVTNYASGLISGLLRGVLIDGGPGIVKMQACDR